MKTLKWELQVLFGYGHNTAQHNTAQHSTTQHSTAQHSTAQHNTAQHSTAQHRTAQHRTAQHSTTQHSTAQHNTTTWVGHVTLLNPTLVQTCEPQIMKKCENVKCVQRGCEALKNPGGSGGPPPPPPFLVCFRWNFLHTIIAFPFEFTVEIALWSRRYCDVIIMCQVLRKDRWHDNSRATLTRIIRCWRLAVLDVFSSAEGFSLKIFLRGFYSSLPKMRLFRQKTRRR